jgi:hypothetical protein
MFYFKSLTACIIIFSMLLHSPLNAQEKKLKATPFQYSIFNPIQLFDEDYDIYGLRLTLAYGENKSVYGVDAGLYCRTTGDQYGFQSALVVCSREGTTSGVTCATVGNLSKGDESGVSLAGLFNVAEGEFTGLQAAGIVSRAKKFSGLQIGTLNHCDDFYGVQFGLVNICRNQSIPFTFLLNFRF